MTQSSMTLASDMEQVRRDIAKAESLGEWRQAQELQDDLWNLQVAWMDARDTEDGSEV